MVALTSASMIHPSLFPEALGSVLSEVFQADPPKADVLRTAMSAGPETAQASYVCSHQGQW
jgi:hypothetical protein